MDLLLGRDVLLGDVVERDRLVADGVDDRGQNLGGRGDRRDVLDRVGGALALGERVTRGETGEAQA